MLKNTKIYPEPAAPSAPGITSRPAWLAALIYMVLITAFFNVELRTGNALIAGDSIYAFHPWSDLPNPAPRYQNFDLPLQFHPWRTHTAQQMRSGRIPLWNSQTFCGSPFIGNIQTQVFYPPALPFIVLSPVHSFLVSAVIKIFLACFGAFFLAMFLGFHPVAAWTAGIIYGFSGFTILWLGYPHTSVTAWAPWTLLTIELLIRRPGMRRVLALAAVTAMQLLAGHPEMSVFLLIFAAAYTGLRLAATRRHTGATVRYGFLGLGLGIAAAMIIYLPFAEYLVHSMVYFARAEKGIADASIPAVCLPLMLMPRIFGSPAGGGLYFPALFPQFGQATYGEIAAPFAGMWSLFLAGIGSVLAMVSRRRLLPFVICGLFTALLIFGFPGFREFVGAIPLLNLGFHLRTVFVVNLSIAILAGAGLHLLLTGDGRHRIWTTAAVIVFVVLLTPAVNVLTLHFEPLLQKLRLVTHWNLELRMFFIILSSGAVLVLGGTLPRLKVLTYLLPLVILLELARFGYGYNASVPIHRLTPPHPAIGAMQQDDTLHRVAGLESAFFPNLAMAYDLEDIRGYDALTPGLYYRLAEAFDPSLTALRNADNPAYMLFSSIPVNLLKLLNVGHIIAPAWQDPVAAIPGADPAQFQVPEHYPEAFPTRIVSFTDPLPRFYTCRNYTVYLDDRAELSHLTGLDFKPGKEVTLRRIPRTVGSVSSAPYYSILELIHCEPGQIQLSVESSRPALLASSQTFFPGWRATVDNAPAEILRCNFAFQAVEIPPGSSRVMFRYEPVSYRLGAFVSLAAAAAWLMLLVLTRRSETTIPDTRRRKTAGTL